MLFLVGLGIMLAGIITAVVVARKGVNRSGDLMGDALLGAASAIDGFGDGFGRGQTTRQSVNNGFSAMFKSMVKSQLKMAKKNWGLFLAGLLAYLAIVFGIGCMIIWVIHFLWTLFF